MVMAPAHAATGLAAGAVAAHILAPAVGLHPSTSQQIAFALLTTGAAIVPDLDCPGATAARSLGPLTGLPSRMIAGLSAWTYRHTSTEYDDDREGDHRGITHTWPGALVFATLAGLGSAAGRFGLPITVGILLLFALRSLPPRNRIVPDLIMSVGLAVLITWLLRGLPAVGLFVAAAVLLGCLTHDLGDAPTESGCPIAFPKTIRGQRWYPVSLPKWLRFHADNRVANWIISLASFAVVALIVWSAIHPLFTHAVEAR